MKEFRMIELAKRRLTLCFSFNKHKRLHSLEFWPQPEMHTAGCVLRTEWSHGMSRFLRTEWSS